jgi:hypothetical protein
MTLHSSVSRALVLGLASACLACSGRPAPEPVTAAPQAVAIAHREAIDPPPAPPTDGGATKEATTIAAVWKDRAVLAGQTVTVRGKIVKYNGGILGVNWMHVQDGSGSAADGSNDLTVTSETEGRVGDVISATGILAINRDIGSGYQYGAIIERARVAKP